MKKILSILTIGCALTLSSCEDWLDKYPLSKMSPETFFSNENELQAFSNKFYTVIPRATDFTTKYCDNLVHSDLAARRCAAAARFPASGGGWTWTDLRKFNTLLEYSGNCKDTDIRNALRRRGPFLPRLLLFREGEALRRRALVCQAPRFGRPRAEASPRLARIRHAAHDRGHRLRHLPPADRPQSSTA